MRIATSSAQDTIALGARLGALLQAGDVVVLAGDLGAGKTTFVKGVATELGIAEAIVSPTFTIVREYHGRLPLAHLDVYRVRRIAELREIGFDEIIDDQRVAMIEWGDAIVSELAGPYLEVRIELGEDEHQRLITFAGVGTGWVERLGRLAQIGGLDAAARH